MNTFSKSFMQVVKRTVNPVFSDIQLNKRYYKTDPGLRGDRIEVRYDPFSTQDTVELYSLNNVYLGQGYFHQRTEAEPIVPSLPEKPKSNYLALLQRRHQQDLAAKTQGIDYRKAVEHRLWPFHEFARLIADLLGKKGGLGSFNNQELEVLKKTWTMNATINTAMVRQACAAAPLKTIAHVSRELKTLFCRGE
ncbi:MAG: Mu transposase C-terminal domain-containing protein [Pseudomonadota bacterium]